MSDPRDVQPNEAELIAAAQAGQLSAFGSLIGFYQDRLYNLGYRLCGSHDDAAELTQETFLRALKGIGQFQRRSRFYTWMVRIMINLSRDMHDRARRETRHVAAQAHDLLKHSQAAQMARAQNPGARLENRETAEIIQQGIEALDPHLRETLVLREVEQMSYRDIAETLKISEGTVKSRVFRAREALRSVLAPYVEEGR
ncbi:MAG: sigma-70 family RNA polymerase sigma factor [Phycisphaerae bacterium]|nr:sigma-70 family RNA polymerase sigma factor [Phycisphaerae bacterium]